MTNKALTPLQCLKIIEVEQAFRLKAWGKVVADGGMTSETARHRFWCLKEAEEIVRGTQPRKGRKSDVEVMEEITTWLKSVRKHVANQIIEREIQTAEAKLLIESVVGVQNFLKEKMRITQ